MTNKPQAPNMEKKNPKTPYELEERTLQFAKRVVFWTKKLPKNISNTEYTRQVIRSAGSIGANYIEANESLSKKDFTHRVKIARKEAKETAHWIRLLIETNDSKFSEEGKELHQEAIELKKILSSMIAK